jgi:hypothetical protein
MTVTKPFKVIGADSLILQTNHSAEKWGKCSEMQKKTVPTE